MIFLAHVLIYSRGFHFLIQPCGFGAIIISEAVRQTCNAWAKCGPGAKCGILADFNWPVIGYLEIRKHNMECKAFYSRTHTFPAENLQPVYHHFGKFGINLTISLHNTLTSKTLRCVSGVIHIWVRYKCVTHAQTNRQTFLPGFHSNLAH